MKNKRIKYPVKILVSLEEELNTRVEKKCKECKVYKSEFVRDAIRAMLS